MSPKFEILVFAFAFSFLVASTYYFPHSIDTGVAWLLTSFITCSYGLACRYERLDSPDYQFHKSPNIVKVVQFGILLFVVWSIVNMTAAIRNNDKLEPESHWMSFIATMMGLKWNILLYRFIKSISGSVENTNRRALLSPIGEIA